MKKYVATIIVTMLIVLGIIFGARAVDASDGSMFNWYDECGYTCYQWADGSGDCYPCYEGETCYVPTPDPTATPIIPPPVPTATPTPEATDTPEEACNRGIGNGAENCDPGNSGGKPGSAGEDNE